MICALCKVEAARQEDIRCALAEISKSCRSAGGHYVKRQNHHKESRRGLIRAVRLVLW